MLDNLQLLFVYAPVMNVQMILDGIFIGAVFALAAYGLALVWGVMNVKNLAQGDFVIMGGYIAFTAHNLGIHPIFALPFIAFVMFIYGLVVYQLVIKRVIDNDMFVSLLATFGLSLFMQQVMNLIYGPEVQTVDSHMYIMTMFDDFVTVPTVKIVSLALAAVFATAIVIFMTRSRMGQSYSCHCPRRKGSACFRYRYKQSLHVYVCAELCDLRDCWCAGVNDLGFATILWNSIFAPYLCNCNRCRAWEPAWRDYHELYPGMG